MTVQNPWDTVKNLGAPLTLKADALGLQLRDRIDQEAELHLVINGEIGRLNGKDAFWLTLEGSTISPGKLVHNSEKAVGFYQDQVTVEMRLVGDPRLVLLKVAPETQNGQATTSSSVSFSEGSSWSVSGGFFDQVLTGSGGFSQNTSRGHSKSFSANLTDFRVENRTDFAAGHAMHFYQMTKFEGGEYSGPMSLLAPDGMDLHGVTGILYDSFPVGRPCPLAVDPLPLIGQAVWQASDAEPVTTNAALEIRVIQRLSMAHRLVKGAKETLSERLRSASIEVEYRHVEPIPFSAFSSDPGESRGLIPV